MKTSSKPRKAKPARVYWLRVEIDPTYKYPDELMEDVAAEARYYYHVEGAEFVTNDTLLALIEGALQSAVAEESGARAAQAPGQALDGDSSPDVPSAERGGNAKRADGSKQNKLK